MDYWKTYRSRLDSRGHTPRDAVLRREQRFLAQKLPKHLSYHQATINGAPTPVAIINTDNMDIKHIISMPGENLPHGGLVDWMDNKWLIIEKDANNEVYTKAKMRQCNYLVKWINEAGMIIQRWCVVDDGTKYLTGEYGDRNYVVVRGDSRMSLTLPRDPETIKLNRKNRFLLDDYDSANTLAYRLTKPLKLGKNYGGEGVLAFVLSECNTEDSDNLELNIPNYYDYFPRTASAEVPTPAPAADEPQKEGWF